MATESDTVNSGALGTLVAVGTCAMLGISLVVTALVRAETNEELAKKEISADRPYRDLVADQTAQLNAPAAYSDRNKGLVSLPLERAMELTVSDLAKDPNSATPPPPPRDKDAGAQAADPALTNAAATDAGGVSEPKPGEEAKPTEQPKEHEGDKPDETRGEQKPTEKATERPTEKKPAPAPVRVPPAVPAPVPAAPAPVPAHG